MLRLNHLGYGVPHGVTSFNFSCYSLSEMDDIDAGHPWMCTSRLGNPSPSRLADLQAGGTPVEPVAR